jgi:hypothetical protein
LKLKDMSKEEIEKNFISLMLGIIQEISETSFLISNSRDTKAAEYDFIKLVSLVNIARPYIDMLEGEISEDIIAGMNRANESIMKKALEMGLVEENK